MTGPVTTEALVDALAEFQRRNGYHRPEIEELLTGFGELVLATAEAAHQQVTAERDEAISACAEMIRLAEMSFEEAMAEPEESGSYAAFQRAKAACEAAPGIADAAKTLAGQYATANAELARLRAKGEAKTVPPGWQLVPREPDTRMKAELAAAVGGNWDIGHDAYVRALAVAPTPALARAATAREGA